MKYIVLLAVGLQCNPFGSLAQKATVPSTATTLSSHGKPAAMGAKQLVSPQVVPASVSKDSSATQNSSTPNSSINELTLNEELTLILSCLSLFISALTIWIGWAAYKKFLSQKLVESQLEIVIDLISAIYKNVFTITTVRRPGGDGWVYSYMYKNIFQLSNGGTIPDDSPLNLPIFLPNSHVFKFKPWVFLSNPLLPNKIAKAMHAFADGITMTSLRINDTNEYIIIGKPKKETPEVIVSLSCFEGGFVAFLKHCAAIDREIKTWLKEHGLEDLNQHVVSTDFERWLV